MVASSPTVCYGALDPRWGDFAALRSKRKAGKPKTSRPAVELAKPPPEGVQLVDDSETHYATVYEKIPIASDAEGNEYTVSVRIKPGNSELMLLVLSFQGAVQKDYSLAINPRQSMRVISSNGRSGVTLDGDGWYRLELSGRGNGRGNNELMIAIYPSHGTPRAKGDVLFGVET